jgi:hypothetical protein
MPAPAPSCVLCGAIVIDPDFGRTEARKEQKFKWLSEFRMLYTRSRSQASADLSGVAANDDSTLTLTLHIPLDPERRYDDTPRLSASEYFSINVLWLSAHQERSEVYGFFFHDNCWKILQETCSPREVDIPGLWRLLQSFISRRNILHWGHDYGGIYSWNPSTDGNAAWGPKNHLAQYNRAGIGNQCKRDSRYHKNLLDIPWLHRQLQASIKSRENTNTSSHLKLNDEAINLRKQNEKDARDAFYTMDAVIVEEILTQLSSKDVLALSLASRTVACLAKSQTFWKSRFRGGHEFSYVFETRVPLATDQYRDWRSLYQALRDSGKSDDHHVLALQNRARLWNLMHRVAWFLEKYEDRTLAGELLTSNSEPDYEFVEAFDHGQFIFGDELKLFPQDGDIMVRRQYTRKASIDPLRMFGVSVTLIPSFHTTQVIDGHDFGSKFCISGLKFHNEDGSNIELGYVLPGHETFINLHLASDARQKILGFRAALNAWGIIALAVITDSSSSTSTWAGEPASFATNDIVTESGEEVNQVIGQFNVSHICRNHFGAYLTSCKGFQMTNLAIPGTSKDFDLTKLLKSPDQR